ncbi:MAG: Bug family tripartite tricarboxylate transporter substrate binding protein [Xanthobacteraceae bacterium]
MPAAGYIRGSFDRSAGSIMRSIGRAVIGAFLVLATIPANAQTNYPERNIRMLFGFAPGVDTVARLLADKLGDALGKPVIVENVMGASGNIAADRVAKAAPDGYTVGMLPAANIVVNGSLYKKLPYDPAKDLAPVTQVYGYPNVLVVNNDLPVRSVQELVALARASPGKLTFGHAGLGTSLHLAGEIFKSMARIDIQDVPYRGSSLIATDLMGGRITMSFIPPTATLSLIREGRIRALAVTSLQRAAFVADVPTMDESGFRGFDVTAWFGLFVPAGTPAAIIEKLHRETVKIMALPDVHDKLHAIGILPLGNTPTEFADVIKTETPYWAHVIKDAGIRPIE